MEPASEEETGPRGAPMKLCGEEPQQPAPDSEPRRVRPKTPEAPVRLTKDLLGAVTAFLPAPTRLRIAGSASPYTRASLPDATFREAADKIWGVDEFPKAETGREMWATGRNWRTGKLRLGQLALPPAASDEVIGVCSGGSAVLATNDDVVVAGAVDDGGCLLVRNQDLSVRTVCDFPNQIWELAVVGGNVVAWIGGSRDGRVDFMSLITEAHCTIDVDSAWSTSGRNEDICALVSGPDERLLMRSYLSVQVWSAAVASDGTLNVQRLFDFPQVIRLRSRAVAWAPGLGKDEIFVTAQGDKFESSIIRRIDTAGDPVEMATDLTMEDMRAANPSFFPPCERPRIQSSKRVESPHLASRYPYTVLAASGTGKYVAAATMYDPDNTFAQGFGNVFEIQVVPRIHVFDAKTLELRWDLAEDIVLLNDADRTPRCDPRIAFVGPVLLWTSLRGLAVCAWDCTTGNFLYRYDGFFEHPAGLALPYDAEWVRTEMETLIIDGEEVERPTAHYDWDAQSKIRHITDMALVAGNEALVLGCYEGGFHAVLDAAEPASRLKPYRDALAEALAPDKYRGGAICARSLPADLVDVIWSFAVDEDSKDSLLVQEAERSPRPWHSRPPW